MTHNGPNKKFISVIILIGMSLGGCASSYDSISTYADKDCELIREFVRQEYRANPSRIAGSLSDAGEPNDILGALFQSDAQKERLARTKVYNDKC